MLIFNNSGFHLQNQARHCTQMPHILKIPTPICAIFGTVEHRDIINKSGSQQFVWSSSAKHVMMELPLSIG